MTGFEIAEVLLISLSGSNLLVLLGGGASTLEGAIGRTTGVVMSLEVTAMMLPLFFTFLGWDGALLFSLSFFFLDLEAFSTQLSFKVEVQQGPHSHLQCHLLLLVFFNLLFHLHLNSNGHYLALVGLKSFNLAEGFWSKVILAWPDYLLRGNN